MLNKIKMVDHKQKKSRITFVKSNLLVTKHGGPVSYDVKFLLIKRDVAIIFLLCRHPLKGTKT